MGKGRSIFKTKPTWLTIADDSHNHRIRAASIEGTSVERDEAGAVVGVTLYLHAAVLRISGERAGAVYATLRECLPDAT